jgi:hypothetical protein
LVIGINLYFDEVRGFDAFFDFSEVDALRHERQGYGYSSPELFFIEKLGLRMNPQN